MTEIVDVVYPVPRLNHRDWLAGLAMQGFIGKTNPEWEQFLRVKMGQMGVDSEIIISMAAYEFADAMIAEGRKEQK